MGRIRLQTKTGFLTDSIGRTIDRPVRCDRVSNRVGGRRGDSGKVRNASGPRSLPYAHWKSRALKSCRLCSRLPFLHQSCSSNNCQNRHTRMPFVPDSPVEMSDGALCCQRHGLEICGICCCDYTFTREGSEEQEEANDTEQECDGEDDEVWPHDSPVEMPDGTFRYQRHGPEICGICCCDYTVMGDGSEEQEEANDTKQESDGEDGEWRGLAARQSGGKTTKRRTNPWAVPKLGHLLSGENRELLCHRILIRRDTPDVSHL